MNDPSYQTKKKIKEIKKEKKKGHIDDATHLRPHNVHALTPPHTSVHTFLSSSYYIDILNKKDIR